MTNEQALDDQREEQEPEAGGNVALRPGPNADPATDIERHIRAEVRALYDVYSYRHAAAILASSFQTEPAEIEDALLAFRITTRDIGAPGGNESDIPKKFSRALRPAGWFESRIQGDLLVNTRECNAFHPHNEKPARSKILSTATRSTM